MHTNSSSAFPARALLTLAVLAAACVPRPAAAGATGTIGPTYQIREEDALEMIRRKLEAMQRSGAIAQMQRESIARARKNLAEPPPVEGITPVAMPSSRLIDPSVTYEQAITTEEGAVVAPAGTRVNPLDFFSLRKVLVFVDARAADQREALEALLVAAPRDGLTITPILTGGSWLEMTRKLKRQVYYDQAGTLSRRFGVRATPSVVYQEAMMLRLDEVPAAALRPSTIAAISARLLAGTPTASAATAATAATNSGAKR